MFAARAAMMGAAGRLQKASFTDNFNRANESLGAASFPASNWTAITSGLTVTSNRVQGSGRVVWNADTLTDDQYTQVAVANVAAGTIYLWLRNPGGTGWPQVDAYVTPSSGAWGILTDPSSAAGNHTTRASGSLGSGVVVATDVLRFEVVGNVYTLKRNGAPVPSATWTDTGNVVAPGPTKRKVGFQLDNATTLAIDDWAGGDL